MSIPSFRKIVCSTANTSWTRRRQNKNLLWSGRSCRKVWFTEYFTFLYYSVANQKMDLSHHQNHNHFVSKMCTYLCTSPLSSRKIYIRIQKTTLGLLYPQSLHKLFISAWLLWKWWKWEYILYFILFLLLMLPEKKMEWEMGAVYKRLAHFLPSYARLWKIKLFFIQGCIHKQIFVDVVFHAFFRR